VTGRRIPSVVIVSGDPGGANAVAPVILKLMSDKKVRISAFAYREAKALWKDRNILFSDLPDDTNAGSAEMLLRNLGADLFFSGTSYNSQEFEKQFVSAARKIRVPSLVLLDYWSYYSIRFSDNAGNRIYIPDKIAIMDEFTHNEMIREGFTPEQLIITGQPAFDDLIQLRESFSVERRDEIREEMGILRHELVVAFASEPLFWGTPTKSANPGYTKTGVLHSLVNALDRIQEKTKRNIVLVIRPHPRENSREFQDICGEKIRIIISTTGRSRDVMQAADLVCGMTTALLMEACYLGCIVASIQPGLSQPDILPLNRLGYSVPIYKEEDIIPVLQTLLLDEKMRNSIRNKCLSLIPDTRSADRVVQQIYSMCGILSEESEYVETCIVGWQTPS
jgi:hypothetical protein